MTVTQFGLGMSVIDADDSVWIEQTIPASMSALKMSRHLDIDPAGSNLPQPIGVVRVGGKSMKALRTRAGLLAAGLLMTLAWVPVAIAEAGQAQGDTSGPASGSQTKPSAAVQKEVSGESGTAAGAPGKPGKQGAESGPTPNGSPIRSQPAARP